MFVKSKTEQSPAAALRRRAEKLVTKPPTVLADADARRLPHRSGSAHQYSPPCRGRHVEVNIEASKSIIHMTIKDDGRGFRVSERMCFEKKTRLGLIGMRERAEMMGGSFQVESAPGGPTTIQVEIPAT